MILLSLLTALAFGADPFSACDVELPSQPEGREAYRCYYMAARRTGDYDRAIARLAELTKERPTSGWARLTYANLLFDQFDPSCREHYAAALEMLTTAGDARGEVYTCLAYAKFLNDQAEVAERDRLLDRAVTVAERSGDRATWSAAQLQKARIWVAEGTHLGEAEQILQEVEPHVFPDGEYQARILLLNTLCNLYYATSRPDLGMPQLLRLAALAEAEGDVFVLAGAKAHLADLVVAHPEGTGSIHGGDPKGFVQGALEVARQGGNPAGEADALGLLAQLEADPAVADALFAESLAIAEASEDPLYVSEALQAWAAALSTRDPERAIAMADRIERIAHDYDLLEDASQAPWLRAAALWTQGDREGSRAAADLALDRWERMRDLNAEDTVNARYGAGGAYWYHDEADRWFSAPDGLERAWLVTERMRAVSVRSALDREASAQQVSGEAQDRRAEIDRAIAVERDRLWEDLSQADRDAVVARLEASRADRGRLLEEVGLREGAPIAPIALSDVQAALADGEILLSFLVPDHRVTRTPARVIRVSRGSVDVFALPAPAELARRVDMFLGLLAARDGSEAAPAAALHADLLGEALSGVPEGARIVVVPDGPLHRLPLGLLRPTAAAAPLATRHVFTTAPSGSVWYRWRSVPRSTPVAGWVVLSDPASGDAMARLPRARAEAERVAAAWPGALRLEDVAATEAALRADLTGHDGLYFAAHAVTDVVYPERSAILLAAGGDDDGRLTAAEIARLPLQDRLIVLSACRSAGGVVAGGEGPLGLSRAFFRAGARTVIGSLWPLRDDDAEALFEAFGRHLAAGVPAELALAEAQRERIAAGAPAEAWAGVVLLGDGAVVAPGRRGISGAWLAAGVVAVGAAGAAIFGLRRA